MSGKNTKKEFFIKIVLPTLLAIILFTISIFAIIVPSFKANMLDRKREMIKELTNSAWSILADFELKEKDSSLTREEAQQQSLKRIEHLRYGTEQKDYFWITDFQPNMIIHPYRPELNNSNLSGYQDPTGKKLFVEFVKVVSENGEGYVDYMWQWKDDSTHIVPKLSFVKEFKPWGWIIGTGIYIEDVNHEISELTQRLIFISTAILILLSFILLFIMQQSLKIEKKKLEAEQKVKDSEAKYRMLVEASTEGLVMLLESDYVYANKTLYSLLGYSQNHETDIYDILCGGKNAESTAGKYFFDLKQGTIPKRQFEGRICKQDGSPVDVILFISEISLSGKTGYTIIVKDISTHKEISEQLDQSKEKFNTLTNNIRIGVFRSTLGRKGRIVEANRAVLQILGYESMEDLGEINIFEIFHESDDRRIFLKKLNEEEAVKNSVVQIDRGDGTSSVISVSAVLIKDDSGNPVYCDGLVEDITEKIRVDEQRDNLIAELQTSLHFLNQPIVYFTKDIISCDMNTPINKAAAWMTRNKYSAVIIKSESGIPVGIVTDRDLRERVVAGNYDLNKPVHEIMTSPLISIDSNALIFEALMMMHDKSTRHLAVKNKQGEILSSISSEELLQVQRSSSTFLIREINNAEEVDDIKKSHDRLPHIIKTLVDSGAKSKNITRIISSVSDAIVKKLVSLAIKELGDAPVQFAFIALGSEGREEQTLMTDQDNAIIFENTEHENTEHVHSYFVNLGNKVNDWLDYCGYTYCRGENMARNPKWSQPLDVWKQYFKKWITTSDPQDLIDISIFFDFRCIYGNAKLAGELRKYLFNTAENKAAFFQHLTINCLSHRLPIGLLGNIIVDSSGEHPETFDIKKAIMPVIDFARIYSLKNKIDCTNTLDRLQELLTKNILPRNTYLELLQAYNILMQIRFRHQIYSVGYNRAADNFINPEKLTQIEQKTLKNTFSQISSIQKKLSYDFTGEAL